MVSEVMATITVKEEEMSWLFSVEGGLVLSLVAVLWAVLPMVLQKKAALNKAQHDDGQPPDNGGGDLAPEARAVIEAAADVIEVAQRRPWGAEELGFFRRDLERIYDVVEDVERSLQPAPLPPDPPDPAAGNGQGPGQPGPDPGAANPGAVS